MKVKKSIEMKNLNLSALSAVKEPNIELDWLVTKGKTKQLKFIAKSQILKGEAILKSLGLDNIELGEGEHLAVSCAYPAYKADYDDNFAIPEEIAKGINTLVESGNMVDTEHNWQENEEIKIIKHIQLEEATTYEDEKGEIQELEKGSWIAAAIVKGNSWEKIQSEELNGWSIGGMAEFDDQDVNLGEIAKDKKGFINLMKSIFGLEPVTKGVLSDQINSQKILDTASDLWWSLHDILWYEGDIPKFKQGLDEFSGILDNLSSQMEAGEIIKHIKKSKKAGGEDMTEQEIQALVKKSMEPLEKKIETLETENSELKNNQAEVEKNKKNEAAQTQIKKYIEFGESMGLANVEIEGEHTPGEVALEVLKSVNIGSEDMTEAQAEARIEAEIDIRKSASTSNVKVEKSKPGTPGGATLSEVTKSIKEGK
ncbi:hypothetical protein PM10SUCC1_32460 [Propionigenium maris DSM 9537]|uniref:Phage-like element PBSX protein XkdF domain-containing protein n=1 Tax=Propionigenium maris DSM 9537 TaxID=1123000 RepID=A0A9W6GPV7_9FUSO|nr:XkdF-like putative serine protease domain-containing protein [Propionigenium maris]GLI57732.1 hypothetical protein PM10SUCC1_32460 [Propionigenium maris DSM 9537]